MRKSIIRFIVELSLVALCASIFCAASLIPIKHLLSLDYVSKFCIFSFFLGVLVFIIAKAVNLFLLARNPQTRTLAFLLACFAVFVPAYFLNRQPQPNVILLVLDSLRADHLGCYGYDRPTSPNLDRFALDALRFENCFSQSAGTDKALPAILASVYPSMFYDPSKDQNNFFLPDKFPLISQYLKPLGYDAWGFSANPHISKTMNYARGYDEFIEFWRKDCRPADLEAYFKDKIKASEDNKFLLAGLIIDPHTPYTPKPEFNIFLQDKTYGFSDLLKFGARAGFPDEAVHRLKDLYDGEILEADHALGCFLDWLKHNGLYEKSLIIITSDHGEAFKEHGVMGHGGVLFEERVHIPLLVRFPSPFKFPLLSPKGTCESLVSQVDFLPTILGFLGKPADNKIIQGRNLVPSIFKNTSLPAGKVFMEELISTQSIRCIRTREWKLVRAEVDKNNNLKDYLFKISEDPGEKNNLIHSEEHKRIRDTLSDMIRLRADEAKWFYSKKGAVKGLDQETLKNLQDLGYGH